MSSYEDIKQAEIALRSVPVGFETREQSKSYGVLKYDLEQLLLQSDPAKYGTALVCFGTNHLGDVGEEKKSQAPMGDIFHQFGVFELPWDKWLAEEDRPLMYILNHLYPYTTDGVIRFVPRYKAEYNLLYRQLVVVTYITDGDKVVVLQTNDNNRIANKLTFIQGHVEYSPEIFFKTELEYLQASAIREVEEEIALIDKEAFVFPELPKFTVNRKETFADLEHFGVVYEVRVGNVDEFLSKVQSGESDKHTVTSISIRDTESYKEQLDDWAYSILVALTEKN